MTDIVHDPNQTTETSGLLIEQFKNKANFKGLAQIFGAKIQELEDALFQLFTLRGVNTAFGAQLDLLGSIVGIVRGGLNDTDFATAIRAEILLNTSSSTAQQILAILYQAYPGAIFKLSEGYPADFTVTAETELVNPTQAGALLQSAKPAGVGTRLVYSIVPISNTFTCCDSNLSQPVINSNLGYANSNEPYSFAQQPQALSGNNIATSVFGNGVYLIAGDTGAAAISTDSVSWTSVSTGLNPATDNITGSAFGASIFVLCTDKGNIVTSSNGTAWTSPQNIFSGDNISALAYGAGLFVAVGLNGKIFTSPDGVTWTSRTNSFAGDFILAVLWSGSLFVATGSADLETSSDGITWTSRTIGLTGNIQASAYGNGTYLVADDGGNVATSPDGVTWANRATVIGGNPLYCAAYGNGFIVAGNSGSGSYSVDGTAWTDFVVWSDPHDVRSLYFFSSFFLAGGQNGDLAKSFTVGGHYAGAT